MISIGIITRGKYGKRAFVNIKKHSDFRISSAEIPELLPDFIEKPKNFVASLKLDKILSQDIVITYAMHPDITPEIVRLAGEKGAKTVIIPGSIRKAGSLSEIKEISERYNMQVELHEICCEIEDNTEFGSCFGKPEVRITMHKNKITEVKVKRGAPCGSTWYMAKALVGTYQQDAPAKAGLLIQHYPCRAVRGIKRGIHRAAELHKKAVEAALELI